MKADKLDKEINNFYKHINVVRVDVYLMKTWMSTLFMVVAGIILSLLLLQIFFNNAMLRTISMIVMLVGALVIFSIYFFSKLRGPLNYTEYMFTVDEKQYLVQIFSKKWIIFTDGEKTVEFFKGETVVRDSIFNKGFNWDCFINAHFTDKKPDKYGVVYTGTSEFAGRQIKHKVTVAGGTISYSEVDGVRMKFSDVNKPDTFVAIPQQLYDFACEEKLDVPVTGHLHLIPISKK